MYICDLSPDPKILKFSIVKGFEEKLILIIQDKRIENERRE